MTIVSKILNKKLDEAKQELINRLNSKAMEIVEGERSEYGANKHLQLVTIGKPAADKAAKKFRIKDIKTGVTRGIYDTHDAAKIAHGKAANSKSLMIEDFEGDDETFPLDEAECAVPKSTIPAYKRKAAGQSELTLADLKKERDASPTTKEGMKKLQKDTGIA